MYKSFKEMPIWQEAMDIAIMVFNISECLPKKEDYGLTSQIRRATVSVSSNIAEGFGRYHKKDKINFYYYSRGSIYETQSLLDYGLRVKYFNSEDVSSLDSRLNALAESLNKVIKSLNNS